MKVEAYGVSGIKGFSRFWKSYEFDTKELPLFLGEVPVIDCSCYKLPPREYLETVGGECARKIRPMRGSKNGIASIYGTGLVHDYLYAMAFKHGKRFGEFCRRTGKRFIAIKTSQNATFESHSGVRNLMHSNFRDGLEDGLSGLDWRQRFDSEQWRGFEVDFEVFQGRFSYDEFSSIICLNLTGLDDERKKALCDLASEAASVRDLELV